VGAKKRGGAKNRVERKRVKQGGAKNRVGQKQGGATNRVDEGINTITHSSSSTFTNLMIC
jgi:hypothetical protein